MTQGLTETEAKNRLRIYGKNEISFKKRFVGVKIFLSQFISILNIILILAAFFSFIATDKIDGILILAIVFITAAFGFFQEYQAEKELEKLKKYVTPLSRVIRNGKEKEIPTTEIVPGDIVVIEEGNYAPADGKIIQNHHLETDESMLTGESLPVAKELNDEIFSGSLILKGRAQIIVTEIGKKTKFGKIAQELSKIKSEKTPLQKKLNGLGKILSIVVAVISFSLIPIGLTNNKEFIPLVFLAVSIGVAAIPEGLPAAITVALAIGTKRMAKKNAVVRKMASVETLGSVQIILSDKTGTLTKNQMVVKNLWLKNKNKLNSVFKACLLGNTASLVEKENQKDIFESIGDKTDGALLLWLKEQKQDLERLKDGGRIIDEFVFDPKTKLITTIWEENKNQYLYVRGAPEEILNRSKLTEDEKEKIRKEFEKFAKQGLRVIGFGEKQGKVFTNKNREKLENELDFLGFVGIYDPPREEVKEALKKAKQAGIKTIMVTGDNELTALKIAEEIELIEENEEVITGDDLSRLSDDELINALPKIRIFARTKPEDKLRIVTVLKQNGITVGVTGDGVNDALALKKADIGVAMGKEGTEVAKEASDIVLTDDNYSSLVTAILEGRTIYNNILKSITYLLSGNLAEISIIFFAAVFNMASPLLPTQILWINFITDGLPAIGLASDNKDINVLNDRPRKPDTPILTKNSLFLIFSIGFLLAFICLVLFKLLIPIYGEVFSRTVVFNTLVLLHIILAFLIRGKNAFKQNKILSFALIFTIVSQILISLNPVLKGIFRLGF